jgi:peptide/nickel transport system permease protein
MIRFLARRLAHMLFVLLGVSLLTFMLIEMAPGDYLEEMRLNPRISRETVTALRARYGLNQSLPVRYARWMRSVFRGELGYSFAYDSPVWPLLKTRALNTLILSISALFCSWLLAVPLGVWAASQPWRWPNRALEVGTSFLLAVPDVLIGLGLLALALHTNWLPTGGMYSLASLGMGLMARAKDLGLHLVLPVSALALGMLPVLVRHVRSALLDVLDSPFIRAARGHGIPRLRLLFRHALPAAANSLISLFGVSVGSLLSGSLLIEVIMSWPGVGPMLLEAILERDLYVVVAAVMFSTLFLVAGNLLADILLYILDPRIRVE